MLNSFILEKVVKEALEEDIQRGDLTTQFTIPEESTIKAVFKAKAAGVVCGLSVVKKVFEMLDPTVVFCEEIPEGNKVQPGDVIAKLEGNTRALLLGERTALNFLQRMSGIATLTREFSERVKGTNARIVDTRKTAPGLRWFDKYAVACGGGFNHRYCLADGILIKDNHIKACGGIGNALRAVKNKVSHLLKIEIEVSNLDELKEALDEGADVIMFDNMSLEDMKRGVEMVKGRALIEASGNVSLETVRDIALTGVDLISVGALTHSVRALDISMKIQ